MTSKWPFHVWLIVTWETICFILIDYFSVTFLLHLLVAQGLFFDLLKKPQNKKHKVTRRVGSSGSKNNNNYHSNDKRHQKKSDYVCNSDSFSEKVKKLYNCPTSDVGQSVINDVKEVKASRNSQPCYDDNKYVNMYYIIINLL